MPRNGPQKFAADFDAAFRLFNSTLIFTARCMQQLHLEHVIDASPLDPVELARLDGGSGEHRFLQYLADKLVANMQPPGAAASVYTTVHEHLRQVAKFGRDLSNFHPDSAYTDYGLAQQPAAIAHARQHGMATWPQACEAMGAAVTDPTWKTACHLAATSNDIGSAYEHAKAALT